MLQRHRMENPRKILVRDLNDYLLCSLCGGYFIDATAIIDCSHTFCRACIVRHFESSRFCPNCGSLVHKSKPLTKLRSDTTLQAIVYKVVPSLYAKELQRRGDFYHSTGFRPDSACSDDSVLGDQRTQDNEEWAFTNIGDPNLYLSLDDSISLSMEYYYYQCSEIEDGGGGGGELESKEEEIDVKPKPQQQPLKRFLQCPAAVKMAHLQKFLRMKYALTDQHKVDLIYAGEILAPYLSLMDVAYTFKWNREKPLRFFYLIYIPIIRSIKEKTVTSNSTTVTTSTTTITSTELSTQPVEKLEKTEDNDSSSKPVQKQVKFTEPSPPPALVQKSVKFAETAPKSADSKSADPNSKSADSNSAHVEPDKEEIKAFAERRDREWALQKNLPERTEVPQPPQPPQQEPHTSKKRKKNKHSKNEFTHSKKRKLHAEITSNEVSSKSDDSLKLKVKLSVANGHKHKHRSVASVEPVAAVKTQDLTAKERLLQMRQVRHKNISPASPLVSVTASDEKPKSKSKSNNSNDLTISKIAPLAPEPPPEEITAKPEKPADLLSTGKTLRSDFSIKTSISKDICNKYVRVNLEKCNAATIAETKAHAIKPNGVAVKPVPVKSDKSEKTAPEVTPIESLDYKTASALVTKNFTVSKIEAGEKRKATEVQGEKRPSLEITVINVTNVAVPTSTGTTPTQSDVAPIKKIRPPPLTIPLGRIQKMNLNLSKKQENNKCDIFGALDLSAKPTKLPDIPKMIPKLTETKKLITSKLIPKLNEAPKLIPNMTNLQMLSESAVQIREMMSMSKTSAPVPNLIKKIPAAPKNTPNHLISTLSQLMRPSKSLQKLPKLTEINKAHFCRITSSGVTYRPTRPVTVQNQTIRNIPNPSMLVRQQNQNRFNNNLNSNSNSADTKRKLADELGLERKSERESSTSTSTSSKISEPPPLKPIETYKK